MQITKEDAQVMLALIERVQISGKEAMPVAQLQVKLSQGLEDETPKEEAPKEEKKSEEEAAAGLGALFG